MPITKSMFSFFHFTRFQLLSLRDTIGPLKKCSLWGGTISEYLAHWWAGQFRNLLTNDIINGYYKRIQTTASLFLESWNRSNCFCIQMGKVHLQSSPSVLRRYGDLRKCSLWIDISDSPLPNGDELAVCPQVSMGGPSGPSHVHHARSVHEGPSSAGTPGPAPKRATATGGAQSGPTPQMATQK